MKPVVVIGAIAAGMSAASQLKRQLPQSQVIVFGDEIYPSYGACGMPFFISGEIKDFHKLIVLKPEQIIQERQIDLRLSHKVLKINPQEQTVFVKNLTSNEEFYQEYSKLVIATGSRPIKPTLPGISLKGIFTLKTLQDALDIDAFMQSRKPKTAAIIGAGFIGIELAESLVKQGIKVSLIEASDRILSVLDAEMGIHVLNELEKNGVNVLTREKTASFQGNDFIHEVLFESGKSIPADLVILAIGVTPQSELAQEAGIALGERGAILTNEFLQTSAPHVYAAGDCATVYHSLLNKHTYIPLALGANRQGRMCGENIAAEFLQKPLNLFPGIIGTSMTKCFSLEIAKTGLGESEISRNNIPDIQSVTVQYYAKAGYYPEKSKIWVKLFFNASSQIILGGQIVGGNGSALRIDVLSAAIAKKTTLHELYQLDLGYCPPFSPVWDPLLVASKSGLKKD